MQPPKRVLFYCETEKDRQAAEHIAARFSPEFVAVLSGPIFELGYYALRLEPALGEERVSASPVESTEPSLTLPDALRVVDPQMPIGKSHAPELAQDVAAPGEGPGLEPAALDAAEAECDQSAERTPSPDWAKAPRLP